MTAPDVQGHECARRNDGARDGVNGDVRERSPMDGVTRWLRWDAGRGDGDGGWVIWRTCTGWCHVDRAETTVQGWDIGSSGRFVEVANFLQLLVDALIDVPVVGPV